MSRPKELTYLPGLKNLAFALAEPQEDGKRRNLDQQAREIGIDRSSYNNLIYLRKTASLAAARDIARYFGVPIETLLEAVPEKVFA